MIKIFFKLFLNVFIFYLLATHFFNVNAALKPSFDCLNATHQAELEICHDENLILLDNKLNQTYIKALGVANGLGDSPQRAVRDLKIWHSAMTRGRYDCWKSANLKKCIKNSYKNDISWLQAKWMLVPAEKTIRYLCSNKAEVVITHFRTDQLPSLTVELGDKREVFIKMLPKRVEKYEGLFGKYLILKGKKLTLRWDQFQPEFKCQEISLQ